MDAQRFCIEILAGASQLKVGRSKEKEDMEGDTVSQVARPQRGNAGGLEAAYCSHTAVWRGQAQPAIQLSLNPPPPSIPPPQRMYTHREMTSPGWQQNPWQHRPAVAEGLGA